MLLEANELGLPVTLERADALRSYPYIAMLVTKIY